MAGYNLKNVDEVKEYLHNLRIEYEFGCCREKKPEVCHLLGDYMESIDTDFKKAADLYEMNCNEYKYGPSCSKFGSYNMLGRGIEVDMKKAYEYTSKGCELDDTRGCLHAGVIAVNGYQVENDAARQIKKGVEMLTKACNADNERACYVLSDVYSSGINGYLEPDMKKAYEMSLKSCEAGNPHACANVSMMHRLGNGVEKNEEMANAFIHKAQVLLQELTVPKEQLKFHQGLKM